MKSAPEMAVKLALNAHLKQLLAENPASLQPHERVVCGGVSGMVSQVRRVVTILSTTATSLHPTISRSIFTHRNPFSFSLSDTRPSWYVKAVTYPLEVIRTRLALAKHGTYKGMFDMIVKVRAPPVYGPCHDGTLP
jgi:hypothetical protein